MRLQASIFSLIFFASGFGSYAQSCLEGNYPFNGNANDISGNAYNGTVNGAVLTTDRFGSANSAYDFDGVDDYIDLGNDFDYEERTISVWFYADNIHANNGMIFNSDHPGMQYGNAMMRPMEVNGTKVLRMNAGGGGTTTVHDEPINEQQWYMATIVMDADSIWYYLDCQLLASSQNMGNASANGATNAVVGTDRDYTPFFDGKIDDLAIYDCAMPQDSICAWFNETGPSQGQLGCLEGHFPFNGNANDMSGNAYNGSVNGATLTTDRFGNSNAAYDFDGVDDYMDLGNDFDYEQRTINVWFYADNIHANNGMIFNSDHPGMQYGNAMMRPMEVNGTKVLRMNAGGGGTTTVHDEPINEQQWYMATIVMDADSIWYYLDCQLLASTQNMGNVSTNGATNAVVGTDRDYTPFFDGKIDDLAIYDCTMPQDSICAWFGGFVNGVEAIELSHISVYPNPATDMVMFNLSNIPDQNLSLVLMDGLGQVVKSETHVHQSSIELSLSDVAKGPYFYQVIADKTVIATGKLIVR